MVPGAHGGGGTSQKSHGRKNVPGTGMMPRFASLHSSGPMPCMAEHGGFYGRHHVTYRIFYGQPC